jgi:hypothetical protein
MQKVVGSKSHQPLFSGPPADRDRHGWPPRVRDLGCEQELSRKGKIVRMQTFTERRKALEAAGLRD